MFERPRSGERAVLVRLGFGAAVDPVAQRFDLRIRQTLVHWRHEVRFIGACHAANQFALAAVAGRDRGLPRIAAAKGAGFEVETQTGRMLTTVVALVTTILEERQDFALKIDARLVGALQRRNREGKNDAGAKGMCRSQGCILREGGDIAVSINSNLAVRRPQGAGHSRCKISQGYGSIERFRIPPVASRIDITPRKHNKMR